MTHVTFDLSVVDVDVDAPAVGLNIGVPGLPGPAGDMGPIGPQGIQGPEGPMGPEGIEGDAGPEGPQGIQGSIGPEGPEGPEGPIGPEGIQGPIGSQGNVGPQGDEGPAGPGVAAGGEAGQFLAKQSLLDYDTGWEFLPSQPSAAISPPPTIAETSALGASQRYAREDHTHADRHPTINPIVVHTIPGASPFTYVMGATEAPRAFYVTGGASVSTSINGSVVIGGTAITVLVYAGDTITVGWTTAPTAIRSRLI